MMSRVTRIAFRFCFLYFIFYSVTTQVLGGLLMVPGASFPMLGRVPPFSGITAWVALHVFGWPGPLINTGNSGDSAFFWAQMSWTLAAALAGTVIWSLLDRSRGHATLYMWLRLFVRFALAAQMFDYGMAKVIPTQFPAPSLVTLVEPVGNLSLSNLLWTSIGASTAYQIFTGCVEMLGGLLLILPRTTLLGALVSLVAMVEVFVLNMTYDFGLKQISFHLILFCIFLIAADVPRLTAMFLRTGAVAPAEEPPLFATARANRRMLIAQVAFGLYLVVMYTNMGMNYWRSYGGGGYPKSALYGIWNVIGLSVDGETRAPDQNDYDRRWRRVIFDEPDLIVFQRTDDSFAHYGASIDVNARTVALTKGDSRRWTASFDYERPAPDRLILDGTIDNHRVRAELERLELDTFRLRNGRFRWVRPPDPYGG